MEAAVVAARARATLGEISYALECVWGRHKGGLNLVGGAYSGEYPAGADEITKTRAAVEDFAKRAGRRPRVLVAKMGQDGHDRGQKVRLLARCISLLCVV